MSKGATQTSDSSKTLPAWLTPYYQQLAGQGNALETTGSIPGVTSMPVAGFSDMQNQGFSDVGSVNPTAIGAANNQLTNFASGQYLNPSTNPYLQDTFHQAANGVQNQIASEFAGNGRSVTASAPVQADAMNNLATQIYGGQYQNGMQNALQASALSPSVTQGLYTQGQALLGAGQQQQQLQQQQLNAPYNTLNFYSQLLNGTSAPFGSTSSTQQNNPGWLGTLNGITGAIGNII